MPSAEPGVGECKICFEVVPSVKVLDCGHSLCLTCAAKIVDASRKKIQEQRSNSSVGQLTSTHDQIFLLCPECRSLTECGPLGAKSLKTRYFGLLKCDLCLEKKDTDDCWWCAECVRTLCSKCSIKEHSKKGHTISEWNKLEPVKYSVNYISQVKVARQGSTEAEHNRQLVGSFLSSLEDALHKELSTQPELDRLHNDLLERYGNNFKQRQLFSLAHRPCSSSPNLLTNRPKVDAAVSNDDGPRLVAKVLQLAGANVKETLIPSLSDQKFQLHFTVTPEEMAKYLRSKIEFIPFDQEAISCKWRNPDIAQSVAGDSNGTRHSYHNHMDRIKEEGGTASSSEDAFAIVEDIFLSPTTAGKGQIVEIDFDGHNLLALRYSTSEVCVVNLNTKKTLPAVGLQMKHECRSMAFSEGTGHLFLALQSTAKRHEWTLESIDLTKSPTCIIFTTPFDIDPEDRVEQLQLTMAAGKRDLGTIYEIRTCTRNVSEIWRACLDRKGKTPSKVKLKETMVYQKDEARFDQVLVVQTQGGGKEHAVFAWDDLSRSLYRLIIRDKRCHSSTKIVTSPSPVPFSIDSLDHLWIFDPCTNYLCVSIGTVLNKSPVLFKETYRFTRYGIHRLWADLPNASGGGGNFIFGLHVASDWKSLKIIKCKKETEIAKASPFGESRGAAPIKRRSFSARV